MIYRKKKVSLYKCAPDVLLGDVKVTVDPLRCEANALCLAAAPEVFDLIEGDDGETVRILMPIPPPELAGAVHEAVDACPKQALRIRDQ
jgi:ferredoxin